MDLDHAHGQSSSRSRGSRGQHRRPRPFSLPQTPSPISPAQSESRLPTNQQRLSLRSHGFRAPQLSAQKISAGLSRIFHGQEEPQSVPAARPNQEDNPSGRRSLRGSRSIDTSGTPFGILNELSGSTRSRLSKRRSVISVYEEEPERPLLEASPNTPASVYHDASSPPVSPGLYTSAYIDSSSMRLREVSGNERRSVSNLSFPINPSAKTSKKRSLDLRRSALATAEYIDLLENELAAAKSKQHSPSSGKLYIDKLKALQMEYKQMETAFHDLEYHFEERVKEAMEHKTAVEGTLRKKIKALEEMLEQKDSIIQELENEHEESSHEQSIIETLKATIERLELEKSSLEDSNRSMTKRNDVLTELLAMSPKKSQHSFDLVSPLRDGMRKPPRPRSMMVPKLPTSPKFTYASRPQSLTGSPALSPSYFSPHRTFTKELGQPRNMRDEIKACKETGDARSIDSGLGESCTVKSQTVTTSRRSTLESQPPVSPSAWGFPFPHSPSEENEKVRQTHKRKPRRFMTGSTQLKPLLLPTMTADSGLTQSPTSFTQPLTSPRRIISDESVDPTISFVSPSYQAAAQQTHRAPWIIRRPGAMSEESDADDTQVCKDEQRVVLSDDVLPVTSFQNSIMTPFRLPFVAHSPRLLDEMLQEDFATSETRDEATDPDHTLLALSTQNFVPGIDDYCDGVDYLEKLYTLDQEMPAADLSAVEAIPHLYTPSTQDLEHSEGRLESGQHSPPVSLGNYHLLEGSDLYLFVLNSVRNSPTPNPKERRSSSSSPDNGFSVLALEKPADAHNSSTYYESWKAPTSNSVVPKSVGVDLGPLDLCSESQPPAGKQRTARAYSALDLFQRRTASQKPLATITIQTIYGVLSRYAAYMKEIKRDPMALARRVMANAWRSNWKRLGKLSWWVLGLFLGPGVKRDSGQGIRGFASDWGDYDGEVIAERVRHEQTGGMFQTPDGGRGERERLSRKVRFHEHLEGYHQGGSNSPARPVLKSTEKKTSLGKSLYLWGKFSVAIMLALGGAMLKGPGEMLKDCDEHAEAKACSEGASSESPSRRRQQIPERHPIAKRLPAFDFSMDYEEESALLQSESNYDYGDNRPPESETTNTPVNSGRSAESSMFSGSFSAPADTYFTFGSLCQDNGRDRFDDNRAPMPSRAISKENETGLPIGCIGRKVRRRSSDPVSPAVRPTLDPGGSGLGTLKWMQTLGITDFAELEDG